MMNKDNDVNESQNLFDDEYEESYYVTPKEEKQRRNTKILITISIIISIISAAVIIWAISIIWPKDGDRGIDGKAGEVTSSEVNLGEDESSDESEERESRDDNDEKKKKKRPKFVESDGDDDVAGDPDLAESIDRPNGDKAQGSPVVANDDVIIKDQEYVDKIMNTAQRGYDALEGLPVLLDDAANTASDEDYRKVSNVANHYYYSDMRDTAMISLARDMGWRLDKSKSHVYEGDTNAPLVGMSYVDDSGELMLYMEGYYDPTIDSFKFESFEFTDAAREANSRIM